MLYIKNIAPQGSLEVPLLGRVVDAGEVVEVDEADAARLLEQPDVWEAARKPRATKNAENVQQDEAEDAEDGEKGGEA